MKLRYCLDFKTGDVSDAGTDSKITVKIICKDGNEYETSFDGNENGNFEKGKTTTLYINGVASDSEIRSISVKSDNKRKKPDWFLDYIVVTLERYGYFFLSGIKEVYRCVFPYFIWFDKENKDTFISSYKTTLYKVEFKVLDKKNCAIDESDEFKMVLSGHYDEISINDMLGKLYGTQKKIDKGKTAVFYFCSENVGLIEKFYLKCNRKLNSTSKSMPLLEYVNVMNVGTQSGIKWVSEKRGKEFVGIDLSGEGASEIFDKNESF